MKTLVYIYVFLFFICIHTILKAMSIFNDDFSNAYIKVCILNTPIYIHICDFDRHTKDIALVYGTEAYIHITHLCLYATS